MIIQVARDGGRDAVFDVPAARQGQHAAECRDHGRAHGRPAVARGRARARGVPAGRPGDRHVPRQRTPDQAARGDAPRQHRDGAHRAPRRRGHRDSRLGGEPVRTTTVGVDRRSRRRRRCRRAAIEVQSSSDPARRHGHVGLTPGDVVVTAGVQALRPGQKVRLLETAAVIGPNLSAWALGRRSLVIFLMVVAVVAGTLSFVRLGRDEDPAFTFRTMVVAAGWPGATVDETLLQVTERLERKLQETQPSRPRAQLHDRRPDDDLRRPRRSRRPPADDPRRLVSGAQEHRRHAADAAGWRRRAVLQRRLRRHLRHHLRVHRRRLHVPRAARLRRGRPLAPAAWCRTCRRSRCSARRTSRSTSSSRPRSSPACASTIRPSSRRCRRRTSCVRPASSRPTSERVFLRVTGAFDNERDIEAVNFVSGDRIFRLGDIATVRRGFVDPPQPMFRVNGKPAIGLAIAMRDGGDILALGREHARRRWPTITANLPLGIEPTLVADQAVTVDVAINDFMASLWQAIVIILVVQLREPRRASRHRGCAGDPADAGDRVRGHGRRSTSTCTASRSAR